VVRDQDQRVRVQGLAGTEARRQELLSALAEQPTASLVTVEIRTVEEMVTLESAAAEPGAATAGEIHLRVDNGKLGVEMLLGQNTPAEAKQVAFVSVQSVSSAAALLSDAWALRRLAERYGSTPLEDLEPDTASLLAVMVRDHLHALDSQTDALASFLEPIRSVVGPANELAASPLRAAAGVWSEDSLDLFATVESAQALVSRLFAQSGTTAEQARFEATELFRLLENLKDQCGGFSAPTPGRFAGQQRRDTQQESSR
jgi:hypothetical protein